MNKTESTDTYIYKDRVVTIITSFLDAKNPTAIVEDKKGEIFEVPRGELR